LCALVQLLRRVQEDIVLDLVVTGALALTAERRDCAPPVTSWPVGHSPGYRPRITSATQLGRCYVPASWFSATLGDRGDPGRRW
jgi:hypothetical protein